MGTLITRYAADHGVLPTPAVFVQQYVQTFGATKAAQQGLTYEAVTEADSPADSAVADETDKATAAADSAAVADDAGTAADEAASSRWSVVKFVGHDADGRCIPTRQGNSKVIKVAVSEHPERGSTNTRKLYGAVLYDRLGITR
ncbi:hypothetical protein ACFXKC_17315 [Streptomyces sp. NPDC059340]|uniref:hypothetical protein n=1 Tax=Streptomyces sp. NPDC059340 TaxID=3346806 RepID=UPI0036BC2282